MFVQKASTGTLFCGSILHMYILTFVFVFQSIENCLPVSHEISLDHGSKTVELWCNLEIQDLTINN